MNDKFSFETFTTLAKQSIEKANKYRNTCFKTQTPVETPIKEEINPDNFTESDEESELEELRAKHLEVFWKKAHPMSKAETLREKIKQA